MMSTHFKQKRRGAHGFTLVEVMVYLAVTVLVASALVTTFLSLDTVLIRNRTERVLTQSATVSLERMVRDIREANVVALGTSVFNTSPGALTVTTAGTTTNFALSGGRLVLTVNGTEVGPLTSDEVTVESLVFTHYVGTTTEMVRVALTLSASSKVSSSTKTFYSSAVLRGSYE